MRSIIIGFGLLILSLLILFKISEVNFIQGNVRLEVIVAIASGLFFFIGIYFNRTQKAKPAFPPSTTRIDYDQIKKGKSRNTNMGSLDGSWTRKEINWNSGNRLTKYLLNSIKIKLFINGF